jgi:hypothetical protein
MKLAVLLVVAACATDPVIVPSDDAFWALYSAAPLSSAELPASVDATTCTHQRVFYGAAFVMTHPDAGRCQVWIGVERITGLRTRQHEYCDLDGGTFALQARSERELYVQADRCALDFDELDYEAPSSFVSAPIDIDLGACDYAHLDAGSPGYGGNFALVHRAYDGAHCDVWLGYEDDVSYRETDHFLRDADGHLTVF